jgi:hypothetical protein
VGHHATMIAYGPTVTPEPSRAFGSISAVE